MNYIVFDLEWNQSNTGKEKEVKELPFEIIEIGAIKLNDKFETAGRFHRLIKPQIYQQMHRITQDLIHIDIEDLKNEQYFSIVAEEFLNWCGSDCIFCTWGPLDLTEFQRNMRFYDMKPLTDGPLKFYDVQKLFSIGHEDGKSRRTLEYAVDFLKIEKDIPFHRAFSDAYYTAKVLTRIDEPVYANYSFDVFNPPKTRKEEVRVVFDNYAKYISREFKSKQDALADREVMSMKCYLCRKNIRRKMKWFTPNGKHYYCVGYCDVHGYVKAKVRIRKSGNEGVYIVKTSKFIGEDELNDIRERRIKAKHMKAANRSHS